MPRRTARALGRMVLPIAALLLNSTTVPAQSITIDATAAPAAPGTGYLRTGSNTSPDGHTIDVNSRFLLRDGKPWLPVMAEFHFARYPEAYWEEEIEKLKAGGVQIVASYIFWIHHEEVEGQFDWSGQRNLRRFVELCQKHGLLFYARVGPWSHGEARNGGFPDWLVQKVGSGLRSNDSTYRAYVARFYDQIGAQLRGLLWKDGGPIVGVQLENEYNGTGPQRGPEHIVELKRLVRASGLDAPLYSVTGWDNAVLPAAEVIPVFGGYPDWPWDQSIEQLPPNEVYAFRFENRWSGSMGSVGPQQQLNATSQQALSRYPFLGAEFAGGIEDTYHRRPIIFASDVAAMLPVQLGSGVNLYGYYMFHGGTNPAGKRSTLQESQRTGYPTDVPVMSYDFQAPLGEFGEMRESFRKLKLVHYFLNEFGDQLAPMVVRRPALVPAGPADTSVARVSARTLGNRGFIFFNNYVRDYHMPARTGVQIALRLPGETLRIPAKPITVPSGAYFIWPVNLDLGGATLTYGTAQLLTRVGSGTSAVYFLFAVPGMAPELAFDTAGIASLASPAAVARERGRIYVRNIRPGSSPAVTLRTSSGRIVRIVVLTQQQAEDAWRFTTRGQDRLMIARQDVFLDGSTLHLRSRGDNRFAFATFPALTGRASAGRDGLFSRYTAALPAARAALTVQRVRSADSVPPVPKFNAVSWRKVEIALAPGDSAFERAARWQIAVPQDAFKGVSDVFLRIHYAGDVARLYSGDELLDDNFFNGAAWSVGLKRWQTLLRDRPLELRILPLRKDAPIFIQPGYWPAVFPGNGQIADVKSVEVVPEYELTVPLRPR
ncbi:MAG TPA: beta-galactosidase [Longimicrobiales bacterium]